MSCLGRKMAILPCKYQSPNILQTFSYMHMLTFDVTYLSTNAPVMTHGAMLRACNAKQNNVPIRHTPQWHVRLKPQTKSETVM